MGVVSSCVRSMFALGQGIVDLYRLAFRSCDAFPMGRFSAPPFLVFVPSPKGLDGGA